MKRFLSSHKNPIQKATDWLPAAGRNVVNLMWRTLRQGWRILRGKGAHDHKKTSDEVLRITSRRLRHGGVLAAVRPAKPLLRDWRFVAGACAAIVTAALLVTLAVTGEQARAGALAFGGELAAASGAMIDDAQAPAVTLAGHTGASGNMPIPAAAPPPTPPPVGITPSGGIKLVPGIQDARIVEVQERLMDLGYMPEDEPSDYYGSETEYALQLFQRSHDLEADGLLEETTQSLLFSEDVRPYILMLGDEGEDVAALQERLADLKYLASPSTGVFDAETEAAVTAFQKRNGLSADGRAEQETLEKLSSADAKAAQTSGGSSGKTSGGSTAPADPDPAAADKLIATAESLLGHKYRGGGKGPNVFDCSGFVYYCLNQTGYEISYMSSAGWAKCRLPRVTKMKDLKRGDVICFNKHVGIYMGDGKMIDASASNGKVVIRTNVMTSSYWKKNFICARRVF